ncbi:MAG: hypothetical protein ABIP17_13940, partial [Ilumatobacteraceae bacterium]
MMTNSKSRSIRQLGNDQTNIGALATQGAICGGVVGVAQAAVLYRHLGRIVLGWPALLAGSWALGWTT